jgi:hypothetical protein
LISKIASEKPEILKKESRDLGEEDANLGGAA